MLSVAVLLDDAYTVADCSQAQVYLCYLCNREYKQYERQCLGLHNRHKIH